MYTSPSVLPPNSLNPPSAADQAAAYARLAAVDAIAARGRAAASQWATTASFAPLGPAVVGDATRYRNLCTGTPGQSAQQDTPYLSAPIVQASGSAGDVSSPEVIPLAPAASLSPGPGLSGYRRGLGAASNDGPSGGNGSPQTAAYSYVPWGNSGSCAPASTNLPAQTNLSPPPPGQIPGAATTSNAGLCETHPWWCILVAFGIGFAARAMMD